MNKRTGILIALLLTNCIVGCSSVPSEVAGAENSVVSATEDGVVTVDNSVAEDELAIDSSSSDEAMDVLEQTTSTESDDNSQPSAEVTLIMVGDILLHDPIEKVAKDEAGNYNYDFIFEHMKDDISATDIALVNQEVIIGGQDLGVSGYPAFNAPYEICDALVNAGFDVVCHATNHSLDKGKRGIVNCYDYWQQNHPEITVVGLNGDESDYENIDIIEKDGIRIAILNYTYGTNGISFPSDMPHAVDMLEEAKVEKDLQYAEENADFTIVCPHWGTEYSLGTDSSQKKWTEIFRAGGADLVIGTHPHVIEPIEMLEDDEQGITNNHGGGDMLVYYSLGNFVSWTSSSGSGIANRNVGGMAMVTIERGADGEVVIKDHSVKALVCHDTSAERGVTVYPLSEYSEELAGENEIRFQDSSFTMKYCIELCDKIWGELWK